MTTIAELVARSRTDQGLPPKVDDPATLDRIAKLIIRREQAATSMQEVRDAA